MNRLKEHRSSDCLIVWLSMWREKSLSGRKRYVYLRYVY